MRLPFIPLAIIVLVSLLIDSYIYRILRRRCSSGRPAVAYLVFSVLLYVLLAAAVLMPWRGGDNEALLTTMWMLYGWISAFVAKVIIVLFDLVARIPHLFHRHRWRGVTTAGVVIGIVAFGAMWWGALINRYRIDVKEVTVEVEGLPKAFDGYRIAQFSDLHTGSFGTDTTFVSRLVDSINAQGCDAIFFTGDIVNQRTDELLPHIAPLSRLKAPDGVFSILGNHDYGDYSVWPSPEAKRANLTELHRLQRGMGWNLLLNQTDYIYKGGGRDSLAIIGVENIGDPPFHVYGSLEQAYPTPGDSVAKILLSHNPAHWDNDIADHDGINIPLTLAGHTHAMQIEVAELSPARFRYRHWGGLYADRSAHKQLYVNIGAGTVGMPARIGATPEITVFTLKAKK